MWCQSTGSWQGHNSGLLGQGQKRAHSPSPDNGPYGRLRSSPPPPPGSYFGAPDPFINTMGDSEPPKYFRNLMPPGPSSYRDDSYFYDNKPSYGPYSNNSSSNFGQMGGQSKLERFDYSDDVSFSDGRGQYGGGNMRNSSGWGQGSGWNQGASSNQGQDMYEGQGQNQFGWDCGQNQNRGQGQGRGRGRGGGRGQTQMNQDSFDFNDGGGKQVKKQQFNLMQFQQKKQFKPGLPGQAFNSTQKKRGRGGANVAPVHSLSKNIAAPNPTQLTIAEKVRRFCLFLRGDAPKINSIQAIENGLTGSKLGLKVEYEVEELIRVSGKAMYTGRLALSGLFLSRAVAASKKEVKHDTFQKAVDILTSKTVAELFNLKDPGPENIRTELTLSVDTSKKPGPQEIEGFKAVVAAATSAAKSQTPSFQRPYDGFQKLIAYIKNTKNLPESKISAVEQGMNASHCGISHHYESVDSNFPNGKFFFRGTLLIGDIAVAKAKGYRKKEVKQICYAKAFEALTTKCVEEVMKGPQEEDGMEDGKPPAQNTVIVAKTQTTSLKEKLDDLLAAIKDASYKENNINTLDVTAMYKGFTPTCVYRKVLVFFDKYKLTCDLYLDNILIASGEGEKRKDSQAEAYNNAWEVLLTATTDVILKQHKRLKSDEANDPNVVEVWVKGSGRFGESNIAGLKRHQLDPNDEWKIPSKMVIIEHSDWITNRKSHAFCILNYSATQNGMLLQWNVEPEDMLSKCTIMLQKEKIGEATTPGKNGARNLASADALYKLYDTNSVIRITRREESNLWTPWTEIVEHAERMKTEIEDIELLDNVADPTPETCPATHPLADKWIVRVAEELIKKFSEKKTLEELFFGPGMDLTEMREIRNIVRSLHLRHDSRQHEGKTYLAIYNRYTPQEMVDILKNCGGKSGKYYLTPKEELPKYSDIEEDLNVQDKVAVVPGSSSVKSSQEVPASGDEDAIKATTDNSTDPVVS